MSVMSNLGHNVEVAELFDYSCNFEYQMLPDLRFVRDQVNLSLEMNVLMAVE